LLCVNLIVPAIAACASSPTKEHPRAAARPVAAPSARPTPDACGRAPAEPTLSQRLRDKFNRGLLGDEGALEEAYRETDAVLARRPDDPTALVFRGAAELWRSGVAARRGEREAMMRLWGEGTANLDRGASLAPPGDVGVTAAYGAAMLTAGLHVPYDPVALPAVRKGVTAYETLLAAQAPAWGCLSTHARCELLLGAGEGWARLGDAARARGYYERVAAECRSDTLPEYEREAAAWLGGRTEPGHVHRCVGCHAR
jgi:hypothetical protein